MLLVFVGPIFRPTVAAQHGAVADAARGDKIIAILAVGSSWSVISLYIAARLSAPPLGRPRAVPFVNV